MLEPILLQLQNPNTQWVLLGTMLLGITSGVVGSFTLLRKQSLIGDAMAHAALPGVCIAFLLYGSKSLLWFLVGAAIAALISSFIIQVIINHSRIKEDSALGIIISVFFGFGIVLLTYIQHNGSGNQSGLDDFIFGQAASMVAADVQLITIVSLSILVVTAIFYKEFKLLTFDPQFAKGLGIPVSFFNGLLLLLIVCSVVIGLQTVGVILMAAMLITPAISARYWTDKLSHMIIISGLIGGFSGVAGTLLSTIMKGMATGPLIIIAATFMFLISLIFAPNRGLLAKALKQLSLRKKTAIDQVFLSIYDIAEGGTLRGIKDEAILKKRNVPLRLFQYSKNELNKKGFIQKEANTWMLTDKGIEAGYELVLQQRLFEMYLMHEMEFAHLDLKTRDDLNLQQLSKETKEQLLKLLSTHNRSPLLIPRSAVVRDRRLMV
ncbi:manganese/zinc/iron transport system permease protein [Metabacillus crassostreae]|uniref:iron chelate uptake ABC transporter family permease subunit n=1 Tax=Metabacillus crassostreae TaxID=929098 RepID=UPI00195A2472|nr:iron chelate uptake ABC transporter family permease subunit [Metabacillus crassostreae]MBM7606059.1 manganese/zinc/iron transport system permease protein [Metabacillus crassostreae]